MRGICFLLFGAVGLLLWPQGRAQDLALGLALGPDRAFCDDKDVEAGVDLALVAHNAKLQQGNQLALYQTVGALKDVNESTTVFRLTFLARESDCPVGGDKEWRDCDYLPQPDAVAPSPCTAVVYRNNAEESLVVVSVECKPSVEALVVPERAQCLGCPQKVDLESEDLREPVSYSLSKFNAEDDSSHHFLLREIVSATRQVVAGFRYDVQFNLEKSNCSKSDFKELTEECHPAETGPEFAKCNSTIYIAPWRREEPEAHVNCERTLQFGFSRRRPPGWSPLRHFNNFAERAPAAPPVSTAQTPAPPAPPAPTPNSLGDGHQTPEAAEKKSSEESQEVTSRPPATDSGDATPDPADLLELPPASEPVRPFNCPTKPWKQFVPLTPPPPPPTPQKKPSPDFTLDEAFSDLDLI
uniref:Kininogen n=1 Tax=Anguilla japonica TaxID=7937 RepID=X4Y827_ANGJA|nr:kininogen precursor [Anguilla japonica]